MKTLGTLTIALLLIGSLFFVQADDKKVGINLQPPGDPLKGAWHGEHLDRHWLDEVVYVDNSEQLNALEPKDDQLFSASGRKKLIAFRVTSPKRRSLAGIYSHYINRANCRKRNG